jgi:prolipoprotein diacylglyceryl transferase
VVWHGGLGIWGAVIGGAVGAGLFCHRRGARLGDVADAVAPGLLIAQAIGRWGNYFNQELFGRPSSLPWALRIDPQNRPHGYENYSTFHPTFLYESAWDLALAAVLIVLGRRAAFTNGRLFLLYVMGYTLGRLWIELLRIDTANHILGLCLNVWTCVALFAIALTIFLARRPTSRPTKPTPGSSDPTDSPRAGVGVNGVDRPHDECGTNAKVPMTESAGGSAPHGTECDTP